MIYLWWNTLGKACRHDCRLGWCPGLLGDGREQHPNLGFFVILNVTKRNRIR